MGLQQRKVEAKETDARGPCVIQEHSKAYCVPDDTPLAEPQTLPPSDVAVGVRLVPRQGGRPPLRIFSIEDHGPSQLRRTLVMFVHGGGLFSSDTWFPFPYFTSPLPANRFCCECARSGKVCVEVDYSLSAWPWELPALLLAVAVLLGAVANCTASAIVICGLAVACVPPALWRRIEHPVQLEECAKAAEWCVAHAAELGADAKKMVAFGESAGGQVALLLAMGRSRHPCSATFKAVAVVSAPLDYRSETLAQLCWIARQIIFRSLIRNSFGLDPAAWAAASPIVHLEAGRLGATPLLLTTSRNEFFVNFASAEAAHIFSMKAGAEAARRAGAPVFEEMLEGHHFHAIGSAIGLLAPSHPFWVLVDAAE